MRWTNNIWSCFWQLELSKTIAGSRIQLLSDNNWLWCFYYLSVLCLWSGKNYVNCVLSSPKAYMDVYDCSSSSTYWFDDLSKKDLFWTLANMKLVCVYHIRLSPFCLLPKVESVSILPSLRKHFLLSSSDKFLKQFLWISNLVTLLSLLLMKSLRTYTPWCR